MAIAVLDIDEGRQPAEATRRIRGCWELGRDQPIPLLLVKLWSVYPKLFAEMPLKNVRAMALSTLERVSIAALVASSIFQLFTGLANAAHWYPWSFSFRSTHYAVAWIAIGSLLVHIAVKLPIIRRALTSDVEATVDDRPTATEPGVMTRRGLLRTTWLAAGVAALSGPSRTDSVG